MVLAAQGAWSKAPAFPTECYQPATFFDAAQKVMNDLADAIKTQTETNASIKAKLNELDGAAKQQRMMAFLQKDPVNAGKYMQETAAAGHRVHEQEASVASARNALAEGLKRVNAQYASDEAPIKATHKRRMDAVDRVMAGKGKPGEIDALTSEYNAAYEKFCAKWWGSSSPFLSYLGDQKKHELEVEIPYGDRYAQMEKQQVEIMGLSTSGFKSTAELEAVRRYVATIQDFGQRRRQARLK